MLCVSFREDRESYRPVACVFSDVALQTTEIITSDGDIKWRWKRTGSRFDLLLGQPVTSATQVKPLSSAIIIPLSVSF